MFQLNPTPIPRTPAPEEGECGEQHGDDDEPREDVREKEEDELPGRIRRRHRAGQVEVGEDAVAKSAAMKAAT
jgi:hypothetical protein